MSAVPALARKYFSSLLGIDPELLSEVFHSDTGVTEERAEEAQPSRLGQYAQSYQSRIRSIEQAVTNGELEHETGEQEGENRMRSILPIPLASFVQWANSQEWVMPQWLRELPATRNHYADLVLRRGRGRPRRDATNELIARAHVLALEIIEQSPNIRKAEIARRVARRINNGISETTIRNYLFYQEDSPLAGSAFDNCRQAARMQRRERLSSRTA